MNKFLILSVTALLVACSHQAPGRLPSSLEGLDSEVSETEKHLESLQRIKNSARTEIYLQFIDSGKAGKSYDLHAQVFSNNLDAIKKAQVFVNESHVWDLKLKKNGDKVFINERVPFMLPIGTTKIRFDLGEEGIREEELVCTRPGKCL